MMRTILGSFLCVALLASIGNADTIIDDYSGGSLSNYTDTVILNLTAGNAPGGPLNTVVWGDSTGALDLTTSNYDGIQQHAYIYNGLTLNVGQEIGLDVDLPVNGDRNLGLYVGGTAPVADVRQDYITVYSGNNNNIATRGFDGTSEYGNTQAGAAGSETMFIARTAVNTYEVGFYTAGVRSVFETRTPAFANDATFVGIYADSRTNGTISGADNLRFISAVPEPGSAIFLGLASLVGFTVRRRK